MTATRRSRQKAKKARKRNIWFEKVMALLAIANLCLVIFDLTYIPLRDFYLRNFVTLTKLYDPIKGIAPNPETERYLITVEQLKNQVNQTGLRSPQAEQLLLELQALSAQMIENNPFDLVNESETLERIESEMQTHIANPSNQNQSGANMGNEAAKQAFQTFWSQTYFTQQGWQEEIQFYNQEIQPLIATNYVREVGENGEFVDRFWIIDLPFISIFALEFFLRTYYIYRRRKGLRWIEAMMWRWYDIFLLLPFWRWLRILPVAIRSHQSDLIELEPVQRQISQGLVSGIAQDLTEVVFIRIINQAQDIINQGSFAKMLSPANPDSYIDLNDVNETTEVTKLLLQTTVFRVMPEVRPDVEALLRHNLDKVIDGSPAYQGLRQLPGIENFKTQLSEQLVTQIYQLVYDAVSAALENDPKAEELMERLGTNFTKAFSSEMQAEKTLERMQYLLTALLEEVKVNYVEQLSQEDVEDIVEQTRALRQEAQISSSQLQSGR